MADLKSHLHGDVPLIAVNPGGLAVPVVDALAGQENLAIFIDCERTPMGPAEAMVMARAAKANGLFSILRAESDQPAIITRYLDCRIDAVVLPQVESAEQCAAVVGVLERHAATARRTTFVAQIESVAGHRALDEIATAPGVDAVLIGPNDLAASMGLAGQPKHPDVVAAVADISARLKGHGVAFGLPVTAATAGDWAGRGARLFYTSLGQFLLDGIHRLKESAQ